MTAHRRELHGARGTRRTAILAALAAAIGLVAPATPGCGDCPSRPLGEVYAFEEVPGDWVLGSARVTVTDDGAVIRYETIDGSHWRVTYRRTDLVER